MAVRFCRGFLEASAADFLVTVWPCCCWPLPDILLSSWFNLSSSSKARAASPQLPAILAGEVRLLLPGVEFLELLRLRDEEREEA